MLMAELKYERFRQEANKIIHGTNEGGSII
jgi:hypothetical protein